MSGSETPMGSFQKTGGVPNKMTLKMSRGNIGQKSIFEPDV